MELIYGSAFYWNEVGHRLGRLRRQLEATNSQRTAVAWAIASITPACEVSLDDLNTLDQGNAERAIKRMANQALRGRRKA